VIYSAKRGAVACDPEHGDLSMKRLRPVLLTTLLVLTGLVGYVVFGPKISAAWSFKQTRTLFEQELAASRFQNAYDLLLTASRIDATQPALLDLVQQFVSAARKSGEDRAEDLADSLVARAEALIPFQTPSVVIDTRRRLNALEGNRDAIGVTAMALDNYMPSDDPVVSYLKVAESEKVPLSIRSAAVEQARQMIEATMLDVAVAADGEEDEVQSRYKELLHRIESAERLCLGGLFQEWAFKRDAWKAKVTSLLKDNEAPASQDPSDSDSPTTTGSKDAIALIQEGVDLMQEIGPYSKASVSGAAQAETELTKDLETLQRYRAWYRNQAVLTAINDVESRWKKDSYETSLTKLADALQEEELLIPYVAERFNQKWNEAFSGLESKRPEKAPEMLKLRFLGRLLPRGDSQ
jgi:enoyl-CoA hydratase/carnithine racemase